MMNVRPSFTWGKPIFAGLTDKRLVDSAGKELVQFWRTYADPQEWHNSRGDTRRGR